MSKKLLEESTIRQFMKLASLEPLSETFFEEGRGSKRMRMREEDLAEEQLEEEQLEEMDDSVLRMSRGQESKPLGEEVVDEKMGTSADPDMGLEEMMFDLEEEEVVTEEEEAEMEMEVEEGDMEAEINITPDQARAIIAVADMLKDIMPDLEAPEAEEEEEVEMDMEEPEMDMGAEEEAEGEEEVAAGEEEEEEGAEEELAEQIMNRVKARLKELKSK